MNHSHRTRRLLRAATGGELLKPPYSLTAEPQVTQDVWGRWQLRHLYDNVMLAQSLRRPPRLLRSSTSTGTSGTATAMLTREPDARSTLHSSSKLTAYLEEAHSVSLTYRSLNSHQSKPDGTWTGRRRRRFTLSTEEMQRAGGREYAGIFHEHSIAHATSPAQRSSKNSLNRPETPSIPAARKPVP